MINYLYDIFFIKTPSLPPYHATYSNPLPPTNYQTKFYDKHHHTKQHVCENTPQPHQQAQKPSPHTPDNLEHKTKKVHFSETDRTIYRRNAQMPPNTYLYDIGA